MKAFSYNKELDSITMEPGVRSGEVCDGLQAQGVSPVGGRESYASLSLLCRHQNLNCAVTLASLVFYLEEVLASCLQHMVTPATVFVL